MSRHQAGYIYERNGGGIENEIADGHYRSDAERAEWEAQIEKLNAQCRAKGGKV